jgi:ribosomal protein S16
MVEITKAPLAKEPLELKRQIKLQYRELVTLTDPYPDQWKLNFFEKINYWLNNGAKYSKLIFTIINLITKIGITMSTNNDKKTTRAGTVKLIITAIVNIIAIFFATEIDAGVQEAIALFIINAWAIVDWIQSFFTNKPDEDGK